MPATIAIGICVLTGQIGDQTKHKTIYQIRCEHMIVELIGSSHALPPVTPNQMRIINSRVFFSVTFSIVSSWLFLAILFVFFIITLHAVILNL